MGPDGIASWNVKVAGYVNDCILCDLFCEQQKESLCKVHDNSLSNVTGGTKSSLICILLFCPNGTSDLVSTLPLSKELHFSLWLHTISQ
jgi:hypothetical protein